MSSIDTTFILTIMYWKTMFTINDNKFIARSPPSTRKGLTNSPSIGLQSSNGHSVTSPIAEVAPSASLPSPTGRVRTRSRSPTPHMANIAKIGSEQAQVMPEVWQKPQKSAIYFILNSSQKSFKWPRRSYQGVRCRPVHVVWASSKKSSCR